MSDNYADKVQAHYAKTWPRLVADIAWERGPTDQLPHDFGILLFNRTTNMSAFATRCMSQLADNERLELHTFCRYDCVSNTDLVEIMTAVAHYHRTGAPLGLGHSVNFGKPWMRGSECTHGIISLPYLDGPELEFLEKPLIRFLWLIPVTSAEVEFKINYGIEALEQRFEEKQFDFLDPHRASVV